MAAPTPRSSERVLGKQRTRLSFRPCTRVEASGAIAEALLPDFRGPNALGSRPWNGPPTSSIRATHHASFGPRAARFATFSGGRPASLRAWPRPLRRRSPLAKNPRDWRPRRARTPRSLHCLPDRSSDSVRLRKPYALHLRIDGRRRPIPDSPASWPPKAWWRSD